MKFPTLLFSLILTFFGATRSHSQTCIVAVKSPSKIVVGADSRVLINVEDEKTGVITTESKVMCKIFQHGDYNFAVAGFYGDLAINCASPIFDMRYSFDETMRIFSDSFSVVLVKKLNSVSRNYNTLFNKIKELNKNIFSSVILFGVENDSLRLSLVRFYVDLNSNNIKVRHEIGDGVIITAGHTEEIDELLELQATWKDGIESGIVRLINIASKFHPNSVGGPIDLIVITKNEERWISKKEMCK